MMTDREKVIKAFAVRIMSDSEEFDTVEIPVCEAVQILELLKEHEAVEPILSIKDRCYYCGNCDETEVKTYDHYCPRCGRELKW